MNKFIKTFEDFNIVNNKVLEIVEPYDDVKIMEVGGIKVYSLFGEVDYYSNKESILAIKRRSESLELDGETYTSFLLEARKRFYNIPELIDCDIVVSVQTTCPITDEVASVLKKKYISNGFVKRDSSFKMRSLEKEDRLHKNDLFQMEFELHDEKICVLDDFITTGSTFRNAFNLVGDNEAVGVCLFHLAS